MIRKGRCGFPKACPRGLERDGDSTSALWSGRATRNSGDARSRREDALVSGLDADERRATARRSERRTSSQARVRQYLFCEWSDASTNSARGHLLIDSSNRATMLAGFVLLCRRPAAKKPPQSPKTPHKNQNKLDLCCCGWKAAQRHISVSRAALWPTACLRAVNKLSALTV
jgi:hypothetical protein